MAEESGSSKVSKAVSDSTGSGSVGGIPKAVFVVSPDAEIECDVVVVNPIPALLSRMMCTLS